MLYTGPIGYIEIHYQYNHHVITPTLTLTIFHNKIDHPGISTCCITSRTMYATYRTRDQEYWYSYYVYLQIPKVESIISVSNLWKETEIDSTASWLTEHQQQSSITEKRVSSSTSHVRLGAVYAIASSVSGLRRKVHPSVHVLACSTTAETVLFRQDMEGKKE